MPNPLNKAPVDAPVDSWVWKTWFSTLSTILTPVGFFIPKLTTTQRDALPSPQAGQLIYNTTTNKLNVYTTAWEQVTSV
jgi:hypothetical protein